jgi:hypothetical protein
MVLGLGIPDPENTYSGSRIPGSKSTRSRIPDPDPQHCIGARIAGADGSSILDITLMTNTLLKLRRTLT